MANIVKVTGTSRVRWNYYIHKITNLWAQGVGVGIDLADLTLQEQARFVLELEKRWMAH